MWKKIKHWVKRFTVDAAEQQTGPYQQLSPLRTAVKTPRKKSRSYDDVLAEVNKKAFQRTIADDEIVHQKSTMDTKGKSVLTYDSLKSTLDNSIQEAKRIFSVRSTIVPEYEVMFYASQSFIGYQLCAVMSQNWLINKACTMPAKDAIRKWFELSINDGTDVDPKILNAIKRLDRRYKLRDNLVEFVRFGRIFGIRHAMFVMDLERIGDPLYYEKPFNIDGVVPDSYIGITQIDPSWITPQLDADAAANPASMYFYEPTWWMINGKRVHRTHLMIMRNNGTVPDVLKPSYYYGGVPVPQEIYQRVYRAEQTANEAPRLAASKRLTVLQCDTEMAIANQEEFEQRLAYAVYLRDNMGYKVIGLDEKIDQFDTSLADLDAVIMTQYQLVAAAARVPVTKLLGTVPKGFNATGEFDESSYHEELESIQAHDLDPFVERHHSLLMRSIIAPKFGSVFTVEHTWHSLDSITEKEQADINYVKAQTGALLTTGGAIDGEDERARIIADPDSGYNGIPPEAPEPPELPGVIPNEQDTPDGQKVINA